EPRDNECLEIIDEECDTVQIGIIQTISVPGYSPCGVKVKYDLFFCETPEGLVIRYVFNNFSAAPDSTDSDCDSLIHRWDSLLNEAFDYTTLNAEWDAFSLAAKNALEYKYMDSLFQNQTYRDSFPCGGSNQQHFTTEFYESLCYKWCALTYGTDPVNIIYYQISCGSACCKRDALWCWSTILNPPRLVKGDYSYTDYGTCSNTPDGICAGTLVGDCNSHTCEP
ncbi:MAG TPA: hypothetical protein VFX48_00245, partial [Saprospiraceae bacterium]|nr:hypothetical protein [Saprospiraceae bacterium]